MSERTVRVTPGNPTILACPLCGYGYTRIHTITPNPRPGGAVDVTLEGDCEDECEFTIHITRDGGIVEATSTGTTWNDRVAAKGNK